VTAWGWSSPRSPRSGLAGKSALVSTLELGQQRHPAPGTGFPFGDRRSGRRFVPVRDLIGTRPSVRRPSTHRCAGGGSPIVEAVGHGTRPMTWGGGRGGALPRRRATGACCSADPSAHSADRDSVVACDLGLWAHRLRRIALGPVPHQSTVARLRQRHEPINLLPHGAGFDRVVRRRRASRKSPPPEVARSAAVQPAAWMATPAGRVDRLPSVDGWAGVATASH
jgi:hypothetical protein